jgi:flagellar FliL protein
MRATRVNKKLLPIIISIFVLFMALMGTGFFILWKKVSPPDPQVKMEDEKDNEKEEDEDFARPVHTLDTFVVNLSDRGVTRYLRVGIVLELTSEETIIEVEERLSQVRDAILMIIPAKTSKYVQTVEGKRALCDEIMSHLNYLLKSGSITNIFFTEFVIQ